jgi:hypothetical protein
MDHTVVLLVLIALPIWLALAVLWRGERRRQRNTGETLGRRE